MPCDKKTYLNGKIGQHISAEQPSFPEDPHCDDIDDPFCLEPIISSEAVNGVSLLTAHALPCTVIRSSFFTAVNTSQPLLDICQAKEWQTFPPRAFPERILFFIR